MQRIILLCFTYCMYFYDKLTSLYIEVSAFQCAPGSFPKITRFHKKSPDQEKITRLKKFTSTLVSGLKCIS